MGNAKPEMFTKKPVDIEAMQFTDWSSALDILSWGAPVFFVPRGYEHHMRLPKDHDQSNGHILEDAPCYLLLKVGTKHEIITRQAWVIKTADGVFEGLSAQDMTEMYVKAARRNFPIAA